ncbi:ATP-dependent RNA helicase Mak5p [[Candida] jaroonii]|uniref:ATP-dependent RNA helicase Mak5p n=1 Tax=[Candida] jaroonii TaxID=467808 RepID=A0ACA9Y7N6_9ASCO|nr:ATP-dependent RNA helicase Mak5p [[Candida] jaroonii]
MEKTQNKKPFKGNKTNGKKPNGKKPNGKKPFKGKKNFKPNKSNKPMSLKKQLLQGSKVVKADVLNWKPVDIPDNLESYEGFFGLEEIEGVDVEIVDGKAQFKVRDDAKLKTSETTEEDNDEIPEEEEEFTGFDDAEKEESVETSEILKHQDETKDESKDESKDEEMDDDEEETEDELKANSFINVKLPDDNVHLPQWDSLKLNSYTLTGLKGLNMSTPTPIQKESIPLAIEGRDIIGKATTGSGKTLAYSIPILEKYVSNLELYQQNQKNKIVNPPTGIVFVPTRELAHQVVDHINKISKFYPIHNHSVVSITGGLSIQRQERILNYGPSIIVATPGRCLELIEKSEVLLSRLASTDIVVLDEADRLLQDGHFDEFERILSLFKKHRPKGLATWKWQTLVFSATFARELFGKLVNKNVKSSNSQLADNDEILQLLNEKLNFKDKKPLVIDANPKEIVSGQITEALVECGPTERDLYLYYFLLLYKGTTLVFANSIDSVKKIVPFLNNLNIPAFAIHSSMIQKQRLRSLERFKEASEKNQVSVLVASDVAARGLDIPKIDHVAHYHLPRSADVYIHRSGRTARAGKEGVSVMFCSPQEASGPLRKLRKLVANSSKDPTKSKLNMHNDVKLLPIEMDLVNQIKPRVELSSRLADASLSNTSTRKEDNWMKQAAEDLGIENMSDLEDFEDDIIKKQRLRKKNAMLTKDQSRTLRYELKQLMAQPIRKLSRRSYLTSGLENLAHIMVTGNTHKDILGHENVNALQDLKGKNYKGKGDKGKITKPTAAKSKATKSKATKPNDKVTKPKSKKGSN